MQKKYRIKTEAQRDNFTRLLTNTTIPDNGWEIELREFKNARTLAQNRMLFGKVYPPIIDQMAEATGTYIKKDDLHKFFLDRYAPRDIVKVLGQTICAPKSSTKFTRQEFSDFIEKIYAWSSQNGVWHD